MQNRYRNKVQIFLGSMNEKRKAESKKQKAKSKKLLQRMIAAEMKKIQAAIRSGDPLQ